LKRLVADQALDNVTLRELLRKTAMPQRGTTPDENGAAAVGASSQLFGAGSPTKKLSRRPVGTTQCGLAALTSWP
jgi:hypothetical protein